MQHADVIVVGLGAMGAATTYQLAKRGAKVIGIDRFSPPHDCGASGGDTRITRQAIGEGPAYVPLVLRAHEIWRELEAEAGSDLFTVTGGLIMQPADSRAGQHGVSDFVGSTIATALTYGIDHEAIDTEEIRYRFPQFQLDEPHRGYYEPGAGFVRPEAAIETQLLLAELRGATLYRNQPVVELSYGAAGTVAVKTEHDVYAADELVLAAGPWLPELIGDPWLQGLFRLDREILYWLDVHGSIDDFKLGRFPIFIWMWAVHDVNHLVYGFPALDGPRGGLKVASEMSELVASPDSVERQVFPHEASQMYESCVRGRLPRLGPGYVRAKACIYTVTPDYGFIIDRLPGTSNVTLVSACSGHGFKHSAAIGEAVAEQLTEGSSRLDLSPFRLERLAKAQKLHTA